MSNNKLNLNDVNLKCSCKGYSLDKLLQPRILQILSKENLHGYAIVQELETKPLFHDEKADTAGIYRALATLQNRGLIEFEWIMETSGPAKKQYGITEAGKHCLRNWKETLAEYRQALDGFLTLSANGEN
jgi:PadR family transcriptional regulator, regulatory protein PadR